MDEPISPANFAAALLNLPLSSLALKVAELRNSIAHLDYSNEQLLPFARPTSPEEQPDADCVEAIQENEIVIKRMEERIQLVRIEVERRGASWREVGFMGTGTLPPEDLDGEPKINGQVLTDEEIDNLDVDELLNGMGAAPNGTTGGSGSGANTGRHSA